MEPVPSVLRSRAMQGTRAGGGFVDVVAYPTWPIGVVADAAGWAGGDWWCLVLLGVVCWCCHWSPPPCPLVCGGAVRGRVKLIDRDRGSGRTDG